jgi:hypothetical protein
MPPNDSTPYRCQVREKSIVDTANFNTMGCGPSRRIYCVSLWIAEFDGRNIQ